jgi:foldase protein PrsA
MAAGCGKKKDEGKAVSGTGKETVIAKYDNGQVTDTEFNKYATLLSLSDPQTAMYLSIPQLKEQELQKYVMYKVFYDQATDADKKEADTQAADFEKQLNDALKTQPALKTELDKSKLTVADAKALVNRIVASSKVIGRKNDDFVKKVTDDEIKTRFNKNPSDYNIVTLRHVLIMTSDPSTGQQKHTPEEALKLAKEAKTKLDAGGDWNEIAKKYSEDTGSKDKGGLYEKQEAKSWVSGFKEAANTQEIGKIGDPVESQFGYHVIKVEKREATPYEKLSQPDKDELKQSVASGKLNDYMKAEQDKIKLKITLPQEPAAGAGTGGAAGSGNAATNGAGTNNAPKEPAAK